MLLRPLQEKFGKRSYTGYDYTYKWLENLRSDGDTKPPADLPRSMGESSQATLENIEPESCSEEEEDVKVPVNTLQRNSPSPTPLSETPSTPAQTDEEPKQQENDYAVAAASRTSPSICAQEEPQRKKKASDLKDPPGETTVGCVKAEQQQQDYAVASSSRVSLSTFVREEPKSKKSASQLIDPPGEAAFGCGKAEQQQKDYAAASPSSASLPMFAQEEPERKKQAPPIVQDTPRDVAFGSGKAEELTEYLASLACRKSQIGLLK